MVNFVLRLILLYLCFYISRSIIGTYSDKTKITSTMSTKLFLTKACQLELALFHRHVFALYWKLRYLLNLGYLINYAYLPFPSEPPLQVSSTKYPKHIVLLRDKKKLSVNHQKIFLSSGLLYIYAYYLLTEVEFVMFIYVIFLLNINSARAIFHGSVILPYILNTICWINVTPGILVPCDPIIDVKIYLCWCDLYFMVQWFCLISWIRFVG